MHDIRCPSILLPCLVPSSNDTVEDEDHDCGMKDKFGEPFFAGGEDEKVKEPARGGPVPEVVFFFDV